MAKRRSKAKKAKKKKTSAPKGGDRRLAEYLKIMENENLHELEISDGSFQIKLVRQREGGIYMPPALAPAAASAPVADAPSSEQNGSAQVSGTPVNAPIAGVFYRASSPSAPAFVSEGDVVKPGQILCIIEAMKVMNEITAETGGRVAKIVVENGQSVNAEDVLFVLDSVK